MITKRSTEILYSGNAIRGRFNGAINCEDCLEAIAEWAELLVAHEDVSFLIYDFTEATLSNLSSEDVQLIALKSSSLPGLRENLILVCIMATPLEFGIMRQWGGYVNIDSSQLKFVKSFEEAERIMLESLEKA